MRTLKITLAYDGTRFVGWQRQAEGESIQGLLEDALARFESRPVSVAGAGRTDAGVHALAQVASARVSCGHDASTLARGLNARLPPDVRVLSVEDTDDRFHARFSATGKTYRYRIRNAALADPFARAFEWHLPEPLRLDVMSCAAGMLVGTHDFGAFRSAGGAASTTVRTITRSEWLAQDGQLTYEIAGNGFLRHMVRTVVGTLVQVGRGQRPPQDVSDLLAGGRRAEAGPTAPPHGLFLVCVDYD